MPLRLRRGTEQERLTITPAEGEPIYVTDTQKLYIGDGTTVGGNQLSGSGDLEVGALEITADLPLNGFNLLGEDSKVIYDSSTDALTVTSITADLTGSVFADDSTKLIDGINGTVVSPVVDGNISFLGSNVDTTISVNGDKLHVGNLETDSLSLTFPAYNPILDATIPQDVVSLQGVLDEGVVDTTRKLEITDTGGADPYITIIGGKGGAFDTRTKLSLGGISDFPETIDPVQPEGKGELFRWEAAYLKDLDVDGPGIFTGQVVADSFKGNIVAEDSSILFDASTGEVSIDIITTEAITISNSIQADFDLTIEARSANNSPFINHVVDRSGTNYNVTGITAGAEASGISYRISRGSVDSPETVEPSDILALVAATAYDGSDYILSSALVQMIDPNGIIVDSNDNVPGQIALVTFEDGDATTPQGLYVDRRGWITIGRASDEDAQAVLDVNGDALFTGLISGDVKGSLFADDSTTIIDAINNTISNGSILLDASSIKSNSSELIIDGIDRATSTPVIRQYSNIASISHITTGLTDGASAPGISYETSRGSIDSPAAVQNGDLLNVILAQPYDGTQYALSGALVMQVDPNGTITSGDVPTQLSLVNFADGNPLTPEGLTVNRKGWVSIGRSATHDALANLDVDGDVLITGNLTVQGTTTAVDSNNTTIKDNLIVLNQGESGAGITLGTAGIEIDRGTESAVSFVYDDSVDKWTLGSETLITGGLEITGAFALPTADGSAGQVLTTDGSGNTSWTTVSGGGTATSLDGDVTGSVFGDNSTLLVDGVNNKIVGEIDTQSDIELNGNNIEGINVINTTLGVHYISMNDATAMTLGSNRGVQIQGGAGANIQIGNSTSGTVTLGSGSNTVDFVSGTTVDFTNANTTGLSDYISVVELKNVVAASTDFADFQTRIANL